MNNLHSLRKTMQEQKYTSIYRTPFCGGGGPEVNHVEEGTSAKMSMIIKGEERTTKNKTGYFTYFLSKIQL